MVITHQRGGNGLLLRGGDFNRFGLDDDVAHSEDVALVVDDHTGTLARASQ